MKHKILTSILGLAAVSAFSLNGFGAEAAGTPAQAAPAQAAPAPATTIKLVEVDPAQRVGAAEISGDATAVKAGQYFVAKKKDEQNCRLRVTSINGKIAQMDLSACDHPELVIVPGGLAPSLIEPAPAAAAPEAAVPANLAEPIIDHGDGGTKIFAKIYLAGGNTIESTNVSTTIGSGTVTFDTDSTIGVSVEIFRAAKNSWGYDAGLEADDRRKITKETMTLNNVAFNGVFSNPSFSTGDIYGNAIYRWRDFYLPFGLNVSYVSTRNMPGTSFRGLLGVQVGVGWVFGKLAFEIVDRVLQYKGSYNDGSSSGDYGTLQMNSANLTFKYGWDL